MVDDVLVSVVVPTYERPDLVREAALSVAAQSYDPIELVVVDDHSSTPARAALSDLPLDSLTAVRHVRHPQNGGVSAARNTGINTASGEYVAFLDDDDRWDERKVAAQVRAFHETDDAVGVVYSGIEHTTGERSTVATPSLRGDVTYDLLVGKSLAPTSTVMVRRDLLTRVDGFDEDLPSWNDRDLYIRLSHHCEFEPVSASLTVRRSAHGADQISRDYETKRDITHPRFVSKHRSDAVRYGRRCERRFLASTLLMLAKSARLNGYYVEARRHLLRSIRLYPLDTEQYLHLLPVLGGRYTYRPAEFAYGLAEKVARLLQRSPGTQR